MTDYYKFVSSGYLEGVGTNGSDDVEAITEAEYQELRALIQTKPEAPDGYVYRLRADTLAWELAEAPEEPGEEA